MLCAVSKIDRAVAAEFCLLFTGYVGDRVAGAVEWNLFDIDAKFRDVEPLEAVLEYLAGVAPFSAAAAEAGTALA